MSCPEISLRKKKCAYGKINSFKNRKGTGTSHGEFLVAFQKKK